ncbi:MAG: CRTAC1 family protein [Deltaproteobacteria bacterium]|nr:MAG: CRTAC1 family protein [Deltaproteobacteria bacterium]
MNGLAIGALALLAAGTGACTGDRGGGDTAAQADGGASGDGGGTVTGSCDELPAGITSRGIVTCADPSLRDTLGPYERIEVPDLPVATEDTGGEISFIHSVGLIVAELTGDDVVDLFLPMRGPDLLYIGQGDGSFVQADPDGTADPDGDMSFGGTAVDIDEDGDLDVVVSNMGHPDRVLINDGRGNFTDGTPAAGLDQGDEYHESLVFGDIDGDGDLDLFECNNAPGDGSGDYDDVLPDMNRIFRNDGGGHFTQDEDAIGGELADGYTRIALIEDLDHDGDKDVYIINHKPERLGNQVAVQTDPWVFEDGMQGSGLDVRIAGMGLGIGDLNGDGLMDLLMSGQAAMTLLESLGEGVWYDSATARGLIMEDLTPDQQRVLAWGNDLADLDNDGDLDAYVQFGRFEGIDPESERGGPQPDALWLQGDDGLFTEVAEEWGVADLSIGRGVIVTDINQDGMLDLVKRSFDVGPEVYVSHCDDRSWLEVALRDAPPNTYAVGAVVEITAGDRSWKRWLTAGSVGFASGGPLTLHFGLDHVEVIDSLTVTWPDGQTDGFSDICVNQAITVDRTAL